MLLPGGARGAVLGPRALVGLARDQAREVLDLLGRARSLRVLRARARDRRSTDQFDPSAFGTARWSARPGRPKREDDRRRHGHRTVARQQGARRGPRRAASARPAATRSSRAAPSSGRGRRGSCGSRRSSIRACSSNAAARSCSKISAGRLRVPDRERAPPGAPRAASASTGSKWSVESSARMPRAARGVEGDRDDVASRRAAGRTALAATARRRARAPAPCGRSAQRAARPTIAGESARAPHPTIASSARSVSAKSVMSASGFSAARRSGLVIPVATATARTPRRARTRRRGSSRRR